MSRVDITEGIPKQIEGYFCKGCDRYHQPPTYWFFAELESKELLSYCLKRIRGLNKVRLVDAGFVWTEPHSRRLKVKLKIQKEVFNGTIIQQDFIVEMVLLHHFCPECHRTEAKDTWNAVAQVRQHVSHKRTFLWIEQMIIKHKAQSRILNIKEEPDGLDFYFHTQTACVKFINFLQSIVPVTFKQSKQLISADVKSNTYNYKFTYSIELPPICKDDLVCLPSKLANQLGNISPLVLCTKVSNILYFIDPFTAQVTEIPEPSRYWSYAFKSISTRDLLTEFIILDIDIIDRKPNKYALAEATVARADSMGTSDKTFFTVTHLGNILNIGDSVYGYDLENSNFNENDITALKGKTVRSEVILVKKHYERRKRRYWKLAQLAIEEGEAKDRKGRQTSRDRNVDDFMNDLEEDPELRSQINLYKVDDLPETEESQMDDNDLPAVAIDELQDLVEDLTLGVDAENE